MIKLETIHKEGFTLIEVLVSLAIIAVISALGISAMSPLNTDKALVAEVEKVVSLIVKARSETLAAKESSVYGVHFEERKAVLFKGPTYSAGAAGNQIQTLHDEVKISALALVGGGAEVVFAKLTGATLQSGTVTLSTLRDAGKTKVITITATGVAYTL